MPINLDATVVKDGDCVFKVRFTLADNSGSGSTRHFDGVIIRPVAFGRPCKRNFWAFLPWADDCDGPAGLIEAETKSFISDENPVTGHDVKIAVELEDDPIEAGNCKIYLLRWKAWYWSKVNPHNPAQAKAKGPLKFKAEAGEAPDFSGTFKIRICCVKGPEGCTHSCDLAK